MSRQLSRLQSICLGLLVFATLALGGSGPDDPQRTLRLGVGQSSHLSVGFADVNGVEVGTRVRIQGIDAGEIEAIVPPENPGDTVKLRLRIAGKYRHLVRDDAKVQIANETLLAGKIVRILPGSAERTVLADHGELKADIQPDLIEGIAQAAGKLNKLLIEVDDAMQAFRKNDGSVTEDLIGATKKLNTVLAKADAALDTIEKGEGTLGKLVKDESLYDELTETLAERQVGHLATCSNGEGTLGKLIKSNEAYAEAVASLARCAPHGQFGQGRIPTRSRRCRWCAATSSISTRNSFGPTASAIAIGTRKAICSSRARRC